jgi:hypothetical protein
MVKKTGNHTAVRLTAITHRHLSSRGPQKAVPGFVLETKTVTNR